MTFNKIPTPKKVAPKITKRILAPKNDVQKIQVEVKLNRYIALRSSNLKAGAAFYSS